MCKAASGARSHQFWAVSASAVRSDHVPPAHVPDAAVTVQLFRLSGSELLTSASESPPLRSAPALPWPPSLGARPQPVRPPTPSRPRGCPGEAARGPVGLRDRKAFPAGRTGELAGGGQAGASGRPLCAPGFQPRPERAGSAWVRLAGRLRRPRLFRQPVPT